MLGYRLQNAAKGIIGPIRIETLRSLAESGVLTKDALLSRGSGPFLPINTFPEVMTALGDKLQEGPVPSYAGDVRVLSFFKIFHRLYDERSTGLLVVKDATRRKDIYLERGQPVFVASTTVSERFGDFLLARQKITAEQQRRALERMGQNRRSFGETLIELGILPQAEVAAELYEQQVLRLVDLCLWEAGHYSFYGGTRYSATRVELSLRTPDLVLRAARLITERTVLGMLREHLHQRVQRRPMVIVEDCAKTFTESERRAHAQLDGKSTVVQLVASGSGKQERRSTLTILYLMWELGALRFLARDELV